MHIALWLFTAAACLLLSLPADGETAPGPEIGPLRLRGYYITFMRMPAMGLPQWVEALDDFRHDGANTLILWMAGAFRSRRYPITWEYNREHRNVRRDFVRRLIDQAHARNIRILLGLTPFGYDGVNRYTDTHPELRAVDREGRSNPPFGIQCWGVNLCPSKAESQRFMLDYAREMLFDFYPNTDGLLIESSDYAICQCAECRDHYYEREFDFARTISNEIWAHNPTATVLVYPHYFSGAAVDVAGAFATHAAAMPYDPRWTLFFTPHSAHIDRGLLAHGAQGVWWSEAPALGTPEAIGEGVRTAIRNGMAGYLPSIEGYSYRLTHPEFGARHLVGKRLKPFGMDWIADGANPYRQLLISLQRLAYRAYLDTPDLDEAGFLRNVATELFGSEDAKAVAQDLVFLHAITTEGRSWSSGSPMVQPEMALADGPPERWPVERADTFRAKLLRLQEIDARYARTSGTNEREMRRIARFILRRWRNAAPSLLPPTMKP